MRMRSSDPNPYLKDARFTDTGTIYLTRYKNEFMDTAMKFHRTKKLSFQLSSIYSTIVNIHRNEVSLYLRNLIETQRRLVHNLFINKNQRIGIILLCIIHITCRGP